MYRALAPQLLPRHFQDESLEVRLRQICADACQTAREVFAHAFLSALFALQRESEGAEERLAIGLVRGLH